MRSTEGIVMQGASRLAVVAVLMVVIVFTGNRISTIICYKISVGSHKMNGFT